MNNMRQIHRTQQGHNEPLCSDLLNDSDDKNNIKSTKIGQKRVVEPLKGTIKIETGSNFFVI